LDSFKLKHCYYF